MNDFTRTGGSWNTPTQQPRSPQMAGGNGSCPNCYQPLLSPGPVVPPSNRDVPGADIPFMSRTMQGRVEDGLWAQRQADPYATAADGPAASTSNYADLGMSASPTGVPTAVPGGGANPNPSLASLVGGPGGQQSPTELPGLTAINLNNQPTAVSLESLQYLNGFLVSQIGRNVTVTFLIGSSSIDMRSGRLVGVGANYILINEFESNDVIACDFYSIKFVKFYY